MNLSCVALLKFRASHLERFILAAGELRDAVRLDVEANGGEMLAEFDRQREPDIAESNDADAAIAKTEFPLRDEWPRIDKIAG